MTDDCTPAYPCGACSFCSEGQAPPRRQVVLAAANGIRIRVPKWLYDRRIPSDAISLLAGREGIGKSTIAFDIAGRVTRGRLPGRYLGQPRGVGVIASEDSWESVILPRLVAAGADLTRVYRIEARTEDLRIETISAPADLDDLAQRCREHDIALLILDPVMSIIHGSLDTHKDREVRQALDPLARFCAANNVAVLGLIHVNKSTTSDPLNSIMASRAFTAVARSVLYCITDPESESEDRYLFGHPKSNLGPKQPTIAYRLVEYRLQIDDPEEPDDSVIVTSRVAWDGVDERSIREVMEPARDRPAGELASRIVAALEAQGSPASPQTIAEHFGDVKAETVRQNLSRMVSRGTIVRLAHGLYGLPNRSDGECDTSLETSELSQVSLLSQRKDHVTVVTDVTASQAREDLSQLPLPNSA